MLKKSLMLDMEIALPYFKKVMFGMLFFLAYEIKFLFIINIYIYNRNL